MVHWESKDRRGSTESKQPGSVMTIKTAIRLDHLRIVGWWSGSYTLYQEFLFEAAEAHVMLTWVKTSGQFFYIIGFTNTPVFLGQRQWALLSRLHMRDVLYVAYSLRLTSTGCAAWCSTSLLEECFLDYNKEIFRHLDWLVEGDFYKMLLLWLAYLKSLHNVVLSLIIQ